MAVKIIGHRGSGKTDNNPFAADKPTQHTLKSYQAVMDEGADGFEFDIFVTQDKVPVVIHRKGAEDIKIEQLTKAELDAFCLASENRIYTLEETLIFIADTNRARPMNKPIINAELKGDGVVVPTIKVLEAVEKKHPSLDQSQIIYDALEWDRVAEMKRLCPAANVMPALSTARLFNLATGEALTNLILMIPMFLKNWNHS